jgi:DMSO/TMAO reductase YedYZ molybdopterin-dependent catalytic subunit
MSHGTANRLSETTTLEPVVRASPLEMLSEPEAPTESHFRRDHFPIPIIRLDEWRLEAQKASGVTKAYSLDELRAYPHHELPVVLECAGHRRAELTPATSGIQWGVGAISEAVWGGTSLRFLLEEIGLDDVRFVVFEGADRGGFRDRSDVPFAKALPLEKALDTDTLLAWEMNGEPLPEGHGAPLRLVVPGWYASDSIKWLKRIVLLETPFDGPFEVEDYRLRVDASGTDERLMVMPVNSLVTSPVDGGRIEAGWQVLQGVAWGGAGGIAKVEVSDGEGFSRRATLSHPSSRYAFTRWHARWWAKPGIQTVTVCATDGTGMRQPEQPIWNKGGYANSSVQRTRVVVQ